MARAGDVGLESISSDDDLIEISVPPSTTASRGTNTDHEPLILPGYHRPTPHRRINNSNTPSLQNARADSTVIDLTEEPDSPIEIRPPPPVPRQHRNPRRTNSVRITPPRLSRSESIVMTQTSFIDLTGDDDPEPEHPRRSRRNNHHPSLRPSDDDLIAFELGNIRRNVGFPPGFGTSSTFANNWVRGIQRTLVGFLGTDLIQTGGGFRAAGGQFGASAETFRQREPSPKPPMEPVSPARQGYTRDTCAEDNDQVVICPACNEELAYQPGEGVVTMNNGKKRRKGEHHFWALKKCGHVYCADCFENRKPTKNHPMGVGFRPPPGKMPLAAATELRCAVEECETRVASKVEWIGIYL